jgi:3-dehydrosphinganine reductase
MLYQGISVHIYFPGSILTPGFEEEQKSKPQITKEIDGARPNMYLQIIVSPDHTT